jgi:hypothetical protein
MDKIVRQKNGGLFILCNNNLYAGMYPSSLADILNCSMEKAEFIIDVLAEIAATSDFETQDKATDFVFSLSEVIPDPPDTDARYDYIEQAEIFLAEPLISIDDVAEILEITREFAEKIYKSFPTFLNTEEALDEFIVYIDKYLKTHYKNGIPEHYKKTQSVAIAEKPISSDNPNQNNPNITDSPHFAFACETVGALLDIPLKDAHLLLASPQALATFLELDDIDDVRMVLDEIAQGNIQPLLMVIQTKIDDLIANIQNNTPVQNAPVQNTPVQNTPVQNIPVQNIPVQNIPVQNIPVQNIPVQNTPVQNTPVQNIPVQNIPVQNTPVQNTPVQNAPVQNTPVQNMSAKTESENADIPLAELPKARPVASIVDIAPIEKPESPQATTAPQNTAASLPDNLPDMLRYVFKLKQRITSKSLSECFKLLGIEISQDLGRFIIEEGGYGGTEPDNGRIIAGDMLEKFINDIETSGGIKQFLTLYLTRVNDNLKSLMANGGNA